MAGVETTPAVSRASFGSNSTASGASPHRKGTSTSPSVKPESETTIGRSPDCGIFLDDVTVSRKHAILVERKGAFVIEDQGSLNGTFVNRKRVESAELEDGDELQIGKYRLTFFGP